MDDDFAEELLKAALGLRQAIGSKEIIPLPRNHALHLEELLRRAAGCSAPGLDMLGESSGPESDTK